MTKGKWMRSVRQAPITNNNHLISNEKNKFQIPIKINKDNTEICRQMLMAATIIKLRVLCGENKNVE